MFTYSVKVSWLILRTFDPTTHFKSLENACALRKNQTVCKGCREVAGSSPALRVSRRPSESHGGRAAACWVTVSKAAAGCSYRHTHSPVMVFL